MQLVSRQRPTSSQNITVREIGGDAIESVSENCWAQIKREAVIPISQAGGESHQKGIPRHAAAGWSRITVRELAYRREGGAARPGPTRAVDPTQATADRARLCHLFTERALFPSGAGQSRRRGQRLGRTGGQEAPAAPVSSDRRSQDASLETDRVEIEGEQKSRFRPHTVGGTYPWT